jgi:hypothetical protein
MIPSHYLRNKEEEVLRHLVNINIAFSLIMITIEMSLPTAKALKKLRKKDW